MRRILESDWFFWFVLAPVWFAGAWLILVYDVVIRPVLEKASDVLDWLFKKVLGIVLMVVWAVADFVRWIKGRW